MRTRLVAVITALLYSLVLVGCSLFPQSASSGSGSNSQPPVGRGDGGETGGGTGGVGAGDGGGSGSGGSDGGGGTDGGGCGSGVADFYVATTGNDSWSGTVAATNSNGTDGPFATLDRARLAVQGMPGGRHIVMIRGGNYFLSSPLIFSAADSGTATSPIEYVSFPCETPVISGGKPITGWTQNGNTWTAKLSSSSFQNFEALFYNGQRRYRPRTTVNSYLYNVGPVFVANSEPNCSLQVGNQWQCFDRFYYSGSDIASTYHGMALGDVELLDFEKWTMSRMRLQSVDTANHIAYLTGPTVQQLNNNGFFPGHRYLLENVQEAFNQPGTWYLDRCINPPSCTNSNGTWTLTYLAQTGENPATDGVIVPQLSQLLVATGLQYVTFQGLTFAHDNWLPATTGLGDSQDMPDVPAALSFNTSSSIIMDGCILAHTEGWAVEFVGTGPIIPKPSNQVINSYLYDLGTGGIRIGKQKHSPDTDANVAQYNLVQNNLINSGGRVQPSGIGTGVWVGNAHHNTVTHNEISDFYSGAIGVGSTWGIDGGAGLAHDNLISYNLVYNLGQGVTSDMGGIYFATSATVGNQVLNNVVHDVIHYYTDTDAGGGHGIYFDQGTSNMLARDNLVYRTAAAPLFNNLSDHDSDTYPQYNVVDNNIFVLGTPRMIQHGGTNPSSLTFTHNIVYFTNGAIQGGTWTCIDVGGSNLPVPCPTRFFLDKNLYWDATGKPPTFITTDPTGAVKTSYTLPQWQALGEDTHSLIEDPLFSNPKYPSDDFTLLPGSPALTVGFVSFDSSQAGRTTQAFTPTAAAPAFPLLLMNPDDF